MINECISKTDPLQSYSLEMTAKDISSLEEASEVIPKGTQISITFLPGEDASMRLSAAKKVKELGYIPKPHLSARRFHSEHELESFLDNLRSEVDVDRVFVVAGDPPSPLGPYEDAYAIINSGLLQKYGVKKVGISGYPEGHQEISQQKLFGALREKHSRLLDMGMTPEIITQFGFNADPVLDWLQQIRSEGIDAIVRIGIAGPASVKTLLKFSSRCGVGASAKVMAKYGVSITKLLNSAGPDRLVSEFTALKKSTVHGTTHFHIYPFGGLKRSAEWVDSYKA